MRNRNIVKICLWKQQNDKLSIELVICLHIIDILRIKSNVKHIFKQEYCVYMPPLNNQWFDVYANQSWDMTHPEFWPYSNED